MEIVHELSEVDKCRLNDINNQIKYLYRRIRELENMSATIYMYNVPKIILDREEYERIRENNILTEKQ